MSNAFSFCQPKPNFATHSPETAALYNLVRSRFTGRALLLCNLQKNKKLFRHSGTRQRETVVNLSSFLSLCVSMCMSACLIPFQCGSNTGLTLFWRKPDLRDPDGHDASTALVSVRLCAKRLLVCDLRWVRQLWCGCGRRPTINS